MHNQLPSIPQELIIEILSCLPVKSLVRFNLVNKPWTSLISHHILRRRSAANPRMLSVAFNPPFNVSSFPLKNIGLATNSPFNVDRIVDESDLICTLETESKHKILGSCNGLVCLLETRTYDSKEQDSWVRFLNPTTKSMSHKSPKLTLANHGNPIDCYGFGYDHVSDTYKVVFLPDYRRLKKKIKVFSMGDTNWRDTQSSLTHHLHINFGRVGIHLNGSLNWLASTKKIDNHPFNGWHSNIIFSFDLSNEHGGVLSLPYTCDELRYINLGIFGECLCIGDDNIETHNFVIWQMKEFGIDESWTKVLNISYGNLQPPKVLFALRFPMCIFDNGDVLVLQQMLFYNHRDHIMNFVQSYKNLDVLNAMIYSESLISPIR